MITVLILAGVEKLINLAIRSDHITKSGLNPLSGKVLRLDMHTPKFSLDVLFNDDHIRLEPVSTVKKSVFEPQGSAPYSSPQNNERVEAWHNQADVGHIQPDCTIKVANVAELLNLIRGPEGNLPIEGDYKILMHVKQLISGFDPDIASQLEPIIGISLASQIGLLIHHLKGNVAQTAKHTLNDVADWANDVAGNSSQDPELQAEVNDLKQRILQLRADVEREEARLALIKAEQAKFNNNRQ